jgi:hypothetical protein
VTTAERMSTAKNWSAGTVGRILPVSVVCGMSGRLSLVRAGRPAR